MGPQTKPVKKRPMGLTIISIIMILFGLLEIFTAFSHQFLGITTSQSSIATLSSAPIDLLYMLAGVMVLTIIKWGAMLAVLFLIVDILGRIARVLTGLYPVNTAENVVGIVGGTAIAVIFVAYIVLRRYSFH